MVKWRQCCWIFPIIVSIFAAIASAQQLGSIRGMVYDKDFDAPLAAAEVSIVETGKKVTATEEGNFVFPEVEPGTYTLVFSKESYVRQVTSNVVVSLGKMTELDASLAGEFTEMDELVVQDVQIGAGTEESLLNLRMESPALMDSIGSDMMSRAGAGDAASALKLISGTTVQDGKYAVVRGLPDRYVNSQMNGVRLPTADTDKRAVQLDQFPSAIIESIQVTKTFTPDQQGDASGGAVNVVLKSIPDEPVFMIDSQVIYNTQVGGAGSDFLTYKGAGMDYWGKQDGSGSGTVGVSTGNAPIDHKYSVAGGEKWQLNDDVKIGEFGSYFHENDSSYFDNGIDNKYWVDTKGGPMTPQYSQGAPSQGAFNTSLFDVTQGSQEVKWGGLRALGLETEKSKLSLLYLYTNSSTSTATLAEDTRGKEYYFPGYDKNNPQDPGNQAREAAPYLRLETLNYTQRTTQTVQLHGKHTLPDLDLKIKDYFRFTEPEFDWTAAYSSAALDQNKTQFGEQWWASSYSPGFPPYVPPSDLPAVHRQYKPAANFTIGNLQEIEKNISEDSEQYAANLKLPFEQRSGELGYLKFGMFNDKVNRTYNQDTASNFNDNSAQYEAPWESHWSEVFPSEGHVVTPANIDVDYKGKQDISACYYMMDMPLNSYFNIIGGQRFERTKISIVNDAEGDATWIPPGQTAPFVLNPGDADVAFSQNDVLPAIGFVFKPIKEVQLHGSYSETVARQTFKELSPIMQQEFLGGDVFIGNPELQMSKLKNYDLRLDYTPYQGGLLSASYFWKDITGPIEYVQRNAGFTYTTPVNYPSGKLNGYELELRQDIGVLFKKLEGLSIGTNATFINSDVTLPGDERSQLADAGVPMSHRDMTNAPAYLYNFFTTYDLKETGTGLALFYTIRGDTLVAGDGVSSERYIPAVYEKEYGTLNFSASQKFGKIWTLKFQAKNILDPAIDTVYRSDYIDGDVPKTSYTKGIDFSIGLSANF